MLARLPLVAFLLLLSTTQIIAQDQSGVFDDYNQWKQALGAENAADAAKIAALPGYEVELIRSAKKGEGSWVSFTFDPKGRIIIAREEVGLLRLTLPAKKGDVPALETINNTLHECRGLLWAYDSLYANANNDKGLYRLIDENGDDQFEEVKLLRTSPGDVGHGRNDLTLGPDGDIYIIHGNDTKLPADYKPESSPLKNYAIDRPIPCEWNKQLFNWGAGPPGGFVIRTDKDGQKWDLIAGGFRNPFGIDFNTDGEMFTFDADMEWEVGLPWYRPCRVNHIVSGGDYGWRQGVNKWSSWYPDSLPSTLDIGLASPTAVKFGTKSNFPSTMKSALFILDWAYGRILAIHLTPQGASYSAKAETFLRGRPLNVTDIDFGPDGAMYFTTGGRGTQSGLYRVRYAGPTSDTPAEVTNVMKVTKAARETRRSLEAFHAKADSHAIIHAWPHLGSDDPWIRHAARVAIERQFLPSWRDQALTEKSPTIALEALMALARFGDKDSQTPLLNRLLTFSNGSLNPTQKLLLLRAANISCARHGRPNTEDRNALVAAVVAMLPDPAVEVNELATELLAFLDAPELPPKALALLAAAKTQEERAHYLYILRGVTQGWTPALRKTYFRTLSEANDFEGAQYVPKVIDFIKQDALASAPAIERDTFAAMIARKPAAPLPIANRQYVRKWEMDDLEGSLELISTGRDLARGKAMFEAALCARCHRFNGQGSTIGPDLTSVAARFGRRDLLEHIISPSKVIDDKYRATLLITKDGRMLQGVISGGEGDSLQIASNPLFPEKLERLLRSEIEEQQPSLVSPMPAGLLDTLSKEELLDLLAYIEEAAKPKAASTPR